MTTTYQPSSTGITELNRACPLLRKNSVGSMLNEIYVNMATLVSGTVAFTAVNAALAAANASIAVNSQKITGQAAGVAATDSANVGQCPGLISATVTPSSGYSTVACTLTTAGGAALGTVSVFISAMSVTGGTGKNVLAAAGTPVGTIISSAGANSAAGASVLTMTSTAGAFSFKITDSVNEVVCLKIVADGCTPICKNVSITGN
jgi:hypothetical protein